MFKLSSSALTVEQLYVSDMVSKDNSGLCINFCRIKLKFFHAIFAIIALCLFVSLFSECSVSDDLFSDTY